MRDLLRDIERICRNVEVLLTINVEESLPFDAGSFDFPLRIVRNAAPKGFGANHNAAFREANGDYFCVLNPDIRLTSDPFPLLLVELEKDGVGVVSPLVLSPSGAIEDSARKFPTLLSIAKKVLGLGSKLDYEIGDSALRPDWVAGIFMLFRSEVFRQVGGFDERYFMYYEDVDLCWRLRAAGYTVRVEPGARAIHEARRGSHRNPRYLLWHLSSMMRFFLTSGRLVRPGRGQ